MISFGNSRMVEARGGVIDAGFSPSVMSSAGDVVEIEDETKRRRRDSILEERAVLGAMASSAFRPSNDDAKRSGSAYHNSRGHLDSVGEKGRAIPWHRCGSSSTDLLHGLWCLLKVEEW